MSQELHFHERLSVKARVLFAEGAPTFHDKNKQLAWDIACPPRAVHAGTLEVSRWEPLALPARLTRHGKLEVVLRSDVFDYAGTGPESCDWWANFADPHLFAAYQGSLLAQDELQVLEHPGLAALSERLRESEEVLPLTVVNGLPTPVLVAEVERRISLDLSPRPQDGFPAGLYGNAFRLAPPKVLRSAITVIDPPTVSNILAIAAPPPGMQAYSIGEITYTLQTALTGFAAAVYESRRLHDADVRSVVHSGFWGCGAFGGNRRLMIALQIIAAHAVGLDRLVLHTVRPEGIVDAQGGQELAEELWPGGPSDTGCLSADLIADLEGRRLPWGVSNGT